jgi:site-specific recombinase XerD
MFEKLFTKPSAIARHKTAPYAEERERYLSHCAEKGYTRATQLLIARELFWVANKLGAYPDLRVTPEQIEVAANRWGERERCCGRALNTQWTNIRFIQVARQWLRFLGHWHEPPEPTPFAHLLNEFTRWMEERGLSPRTIQCQNGYLKQFLRWYGDKQRPFSAIHITDIDAFLATCGARGWSRVSVKNVATVIRIFIRYAGSKGWCDPSIADAICAPRVFPQENLPAGPSWHEVKSLLASTETDRQQDIRDLPVVMLFAVYGLRASEVAGLRLEDLDWEHNLITVHRAKNRGAQTYPLMPVVGSAIIRYLQEVRPQSSLRQVFLTLTPPIRPISRSGLYGLTSKRMVKIGIRVRHMGPHSLRHACAAHLVSEGFSLKEIGDHLGHRCSSATRIYAKVDLQGLREVAEFDTGGLI